MRKVNFVSKGELGGYVFVVFDCGGDEFFKEGGLFFLVSGWKGERGGGKYFDILG